MIIKRYSSFINESTVTDEIISNLSDNNTELKTDIIEHIDETLSDINDEYKRSDFNNFVDEYIVNGKDSSTINGLIEENDIFNFYMKHQSEIDTFLNEDGYLEETPKDHDSFGLHETLIDGTKHAILKMIEQIRDTF